MPSPIQLAPANTRSTPRKIPSVHSEETGQWTRMMTPSNSVIRPETTTQIQGDTGPMLKDARYAAALLD